MHLCVSISISHVLFCDFSIRFCAVFFRFVFHCFFISCCDQNKVKDDDNVHHVGREQGGHDSHATARKRMPSDDSELVFSQTKSYQGRTSSMSIHERKESVEDNPNQGN